MSDALKAPPEMSASDIEFNRSAILTGHLRGTVFQEPFERLCRQALAAIAQHEAEQAQADTGWAEADRLIGRLLSADIDFDDCTDAAAFIRRLATDQKGPDGFETWKDAAIAERKRRTEAEQAKDEPVPATHWGWDYLDNGQLIATYLVPVANPHRRPLGELVAPKLYAAPSTDLLRRVAEAVRVAVADSLHPDNVDLDAVIASATAP